MNWFETNPVAKLFGLLLYPGGRQNMDSTNGTIDRTAKSAGAGIQSASLLIWVLIAVLNSASICQAQVSVSGRGRNFVAPVTDAQGRKSVLRGKDVRPGGKGIVEILGMQAETFRGQEKDMIVEAPQCLFDTKANVASSAGPLSIRTADGRFSIKGDSFRWQLGDSRLNSKLAISNQVHSLIRKRLFDSKTALNPRATLPPSGVAAPSQPRAPSADEFIDITADEFDYQSDMAVFRGNVRVKETDGELSCAVLTVVFQGESGALERIEAERDVVLVQAGTRATADKAIYTIGEEKETVEFLGHAVWSDGERQGSGERLTFDRHNRTLRAKENAYLKLPRALLGDASFLSSKPSTADQTNEGKTAAALVEVFSDLITIRLPLTNGPVEQVIAERNVLIVDAQQDGRALADKAIYEEATGILELTGSPVMEVEGRMVTGHALRFDRVTKVFTAAPDAYVKLPFQGVADLGILPPDSASQPKLVATNQFVEIWAQEFRYLTNRLHFRGNVRATFLDGDSPRGKLTCASMTIRYGAEVESLVAEEKVELEQFALSGSPRPVSRKVQCERLEARFNSKGRLEVAMAQAGVTAEQEEHRTERTLPVFTQLTSESVTAFFSKQSNQVERIVADKDVVFVQDQRVARGAKAVYTEASGLVELTGEPTASMPEGRIVGAERLIWDQKTGRFISTGKFKSEWKRPPGGTKGLSGPAVGTK